MKVLEYDQPLSINSSNGFTVLRAGQFNLIIMTKLQTLVLQEGNLRQYIIQKDSSERMYYSIVMDANLAQDLGPLE